MASTLDKLSGDGSSAAMTSKTSAPKRRKPTPETDMQIVKVDPLRRVYIYIVTDRCTGKIIYVGQTVHCTRRWVQHEKSQRTSLQDYAERHDRTFDTLKFRKVDALPMGCAQVDANRMEAYFIAEYETLYSSKNNTDVANKTAGNHATSYVHAEVKAELERGYQWPAGCQAQVAAMAAEPKDVEQARADLAILQSIAEDNPELESQIRPILAKTEATLQDLQTGPYERAKEAYEEYSGMPPHEVVPRDDLMATV
ncbi:MAG: GIY-YIG nuclease family protein, partial [Actinomycetales bacterium]